MNKNGEEDETCLFQVRAKLFRLCEKEEKKDDDSELNRFGTGAGRGEKVIIFCNDKGDN